MRPINLILVDNNSQDGTLDVLQRWASSHRAEDFNISVLTEPTPGATWARNCGLNAVTTPYVMFFDSDDIMFPDHLMRVEQAIAQDSDIDVFCWDVKIGLPNGRVKTTRDSHRDLMYAHLFNSILSTERFCAKTQLIRSIGGWNVNVVGWDDLELSVRILMASPSVKYFNHYASYTVWQSDSITGADFSHCPSKWEHTIDTIAQYFKDDTRLMHLLELKRIILAGHYTREGSSEGVRLYREVIVRDNSLIFRLAYHYVSIGGRGIARILRFLHLI